MNRALQGNTNIPEFGYTSLQRKPMLICGQKSFKFVGENEADPHDPSGRTLRESQGQALGSWIGAWVYNHRYIVNGDPNDVRLCRGSTWAVTLAKQDMIVFCDVAFQGNVPGTPSAVDGRDSVAVDKRLDEFGQFSLSRIMIHELAHWYGRDQSGSREGEFMLPAHPSTYAVHALTSHSSFKSPINGQSQRTASLSGTTASLGNMLMLIPAIIIPPSHRRLLVSLLLLSMPQTVQRPPYLHAHGPIRGKQLD